MFYSSCPEMFGSFTAVFSPSIMWEIKKEEIQERHFCLDSSSYRAAAQTPVTTTSHQELLQSPWKLGRWNLGLLSILSINAIKQFRRVLTNVCIGVYLCVCFCMCWSDNPQKSLLSDFRLWSTCCLKASVRWWDSPTIRFTCPRILLLILILSYGLLNTPTCFFQQQTAVVGAIVQH